MTTIDSMDCTARCLRTRWAAEVAALLADTPTTAPNFGKLTALSLDIAIKPCAMYCDTHDNPKENNQCK